MTPQQRLKIGAAQLWLPDSAFAGDLWRQPVVAAIKTWSGAWFGTKLTVAAPPRPLTGQVESWKICADGVAIGCAAEQQATLAGKLLGFKGADRAKFNASDKNLTEALAWRCAMALGDAIAAAVGLGRKPVWQAAADADLTDMVCLGVGPRDGETWLQFAVERNLFVQLIRTAAPDTRPLLPLSPLETSIDEQPVNISALIGRCQVTLGDLSSLVSSDVLCLDTNTDAPVALAIEHVASTATCQIEQEGGALRLRISE